MKCLKLQCQDPRWNEFVRENPEGTFFHLVEWREVIARNFGYEPFYLYVEQEDKILGVLPLFLVKSLLFNRTLMSVPVGIYGGVVSRDPEAAKLLLRTAQEISGRLKVRSLEVRGNPYGINQNYFCKDDLDFIKRDHHVTFIGEIDPKEENNFARIPRKQRRMIRQAKKHGLRSCMDDSRLRECFQIYAESLRNLGTPIYSYKYFEDLKKTFGARCRVLLVEYKSKVVAGVLSFLYKDQVLPYYAGCLPNYRHLAANDFMYWELLSFGAANGYRIFDFGRSKTDSGSFNFKRHWGFEPRSLPYFYYQVDSKEISDSSSLSSSLQWAIKLWRHLPLRLTIVLGPRIAPHLPW